MLVAALVSNVGSYTQGLPSSSVQAKTNKTESRVVFSFIYSLVYYSQGSVRFVLLAEAIYSVLSL